MKTQLDSIGGDRRCPPEDYGGKVEYFRILETMKNPSSQEYKEFIERFNGAFNHDFMIID